jgi:hypothetical protein
VRFATLLLIAFVSQRPLASQQLPQKVTQEVFRFGGANAPEHYAFSAIPRLIVDKGGVIYARVAPDASVLVFSESGAFVRRIGRRGEGPGEFQLADGHGFVGDTLWVRNWPTPRISLFTRDGSHIATTRTPYDLGRAFASPAGLSGFLPGGRVYVNPPLVIGVDTRIKLPLLLGSRQMQRADTVALLPNPRGLFIAGIGTWSYDPIPASPLVAISSHGSGIATVSWDDAEQSAMVVRVVAPDGTLRWERRFSVSRTIIPRSMRDSLIAVASAKARSQIEAARRRGQPLSGSIETLVSRGLDLPRHFPPARQVVLGLDDSVWIEQGPGLRGGTWLVLDSTGRPSHRVQTPPGFVLHEASAQLLWGVVTDELDVPYMVKLRIRS